MRFAYSKPTANNEERDLLFNNYLKIGYGGLQLKNGQYKPYLNDYKRFLEEWGGYTGIASGLILGGDISENSINSILEVAKFASKVGSDLVIYCMMINRADLSNEDIKCFGRTFNEIGKETAQSGIKLSLHNHYNSPVMHREDFNWFFDIEGEINMGLTVDTAHLQKSGVYNIEEIIKSFSHIIDNYHLKDFKDGQWQVLGRGEIYFEPIFKAIKNTKYNGWVSTDEESDSDIIVSLNECYDFMKKGLERI